MTCILGKPWKTHTRDEVDSNHVAGAIFPQHMVLTLVLKVAILIADVVVLDTNLGAFEYG